MPTISETKSKNTKNIIMYLICGIFIGLGAVLPGISGGVMCVIFGIYKPIMDFLSNPFKTFKKNMAILIPAIIGIAIGFVGVSKILSFLLKNFEAQSVCAFIGLIFGMLPSLYDEAGQQGRSRGSFIGLGAAFVLMLSILIGLEYMRFAVLPGFGAYIFCGACIALSIIVPGMSFSTLLMPLDLYTPLTNGIGNLDFKVLIPVGIGALITIILLAKAVSLLLAKQYSIVFHSIIGVVIAATLVIIPFSSFVGITNIVTNIVCFAVGLALSLILGKINKGIVKE